MELDGNTFFIYNKVYEHAKLAQWGTGGRDVGTYEQRICPINFGVLRNLLDIIISRMLITLDIVWQSGVMVMERQVSIMVNSMMTSFGNFNQ